LNPLDWSGGIGMRLVNMSGPSGGQFSLWQNDLFGSPTVFMRTSDGLSGADSILRPVGTHAHYNYGFTAEGLYTLTLEFTGTHMVDGPQSYTASYTFGVNAVPEPEEYAVLAGLALAGFGVWRRTRR
jgi:surface-anchored protein